MLKIDGYYYFTYHNIGQGLFYSGNIRIKSGLDFRFIYDCGSTQQKCVNSAVTRYRNSPRSNRYLNLLIISHLDKDHINGLSHLLNPPQIQIDTVILPYVGLYERINLFLRRRRIPYIRRWFLEFTLDPVSYLLRHGIRQVILMSGGNRRDTVVFERQDEDDSAEYYEIINEIPSEDGLQFKEEHPVNRWEKDLIIKENPKYGDFLGSNRLRIINHRNKARIGNIWEFDFFYAPVNMGNLYSFMCCVRKVINANYRQNLFSTLFDPPVLRALRNCYLNRLNRPLNDTSLVLLHRPIGNFNTYPTLRVHGEYVDSECYTNATSCGSLMTGDTNLNFVFNNNQSLYQDFLNHYNTKVSEITFTQIPHHGSNTNWKNEILNDLDNCQFWVASSRYYPPHCGYKHPREEVTNAIIAAQKHFISCNES